MRLGRLEIAVVAAALALTGGVPRKAAQLNREANRAYESGDFEKAASGYGEARERAPEAAEIDYNLGNALYRQDQLDAALDQLGRASQSDDASLRQRSLYNAGNVLYKKGDLASAAAAYRQALDLAPGDRDAKINYEKTLRELQQQQQEQKQQGQGQDSQEEKQQKQEQQDSSSGGEQEQQGQESQQGQRGQEEGAQAPQEPQEAAEAAADSAVAAGELRPEEAERILEAMAAEERELQKERGRQMRARTRRVDKDW